MIYQKLKDELRERNLSIRQCARACDIDCCNLTNCLNGKKPMYPKYKRVISEHLGIDEDVLFSGSQEGADISD